MPMLAALLAITAAVAGMEAFRHAPGNDPLIFISNPVEANFPGHWIPLSVFKAVLEKNTGKRNPDAKVHKHHTHPKIPIKHEPSHMEAFEPSPANTDDIEADTDGVSATEAAAVEENNYEDSTTEESTTEDTTTEESTTEEPTTEEPTTEEPTTEEPTTEEPKIEEPKIEEAKIEEPKIEEHNVEQVTTEIITTSEGKPTDPNDGLNG